MRRVAKTAGLVLALLIGTEGVLRVGLGLGDPPLVRLTQTTEYELLPDQHYHRFGNRISINSHGMRSADHAGPQSPLDRRILLIGDSVIYGTSFLDQHDTIAHLMQTQLDQTVSLDGCRPLVMAAAASSWGPVNQAAFLARDGLFQADLGVLVVSSHDLYDTPRFDGVTPYRLRAPWGALDDARQILRDRLTTPPRLQTSLEMRRTATLAAMDQMAAQFAQAGIPLMLVYHPTVSERRGPPRPERDVFTAWAQGRALALHDLGTAPLDGAQYRDDIHPNAQGSAALAEIFTDLAAPALARCP